MCCKHYITCFSKLASEKRTPVRIPNEVPEDHLTAKIEPFCSEKGSLKLLSYFPSPTYTKVKFPGSKHVEYKDPNQTNPSVAQHLGLSKGPKNGSDDALTPCWTKPSKKGWDQSKGLIVFALTGGTERHVSQVANAVFIARHLGAAIGIPDIIGNRPDDKRKFGEIYDVNKFVTSLEGVIKISETQPAEVSNENLTLVRVPNWVSEEYVTSKVKPLFIKKGHLKLVPYFRTSPVTRLGEKEHMNSIFCLAILESLQLQAGLQKVINSMVESVKSLSEKSDGWVIAVDLRVDMLGTKRCHRSIANKRKSCYDPQEIGQFLKKIGLERETTMIYLTQNGWANSLNALKDFYPNTYTKESLVPAENVVKLLNPETSVFKDVIDFFMCSQSDVFVPAFSNLFYDNVVGKRIASGKTLVLEPGRSNSSEAVDYISPYISEKSHSAYSCLC